MGGAVEEGGDLGRDVLVCCVEVAGFGVDECSVREGGRRYQSRG